MNTWLRILLRSIKRRFFGRIPRPWFSAQSRAFTKTLLIVCPPGFRQDQQTASSMMRVGLARGWAQACGPVKLVFPSHLWREFDEHDHPAVSISQSEFCDMSYAQTRRLRQADLFVSVNPHPRVVARWEKLVPLSPPEEHQVWLNTYAKVLSAEPKFVWDSVGQAGAEWFQGWRDDGLRWETIHLAVDTQRYFPDPAPEKYSYIKMAYVGAYWAEKAQAFDLYLRPWETILVPFGNKKWPYKHYAGRLGKADERQLYSSAGIIPLITGPAGWLLAEITERYFKAPGCAAFCIADQNPTLREIFTADEMLQAEDPDHFHSLVRDALEGKIDCSAWAQKAYRAVMQRHRYADRARQILRALQGAKV